MQFHNASSLKQHSSDRNVAQPRPIILIQAIQSLLFLIDAACIVEKQQLHISYSSVWADWGSKP